MTKEILFKAQRADTRGWVVGYFTLNGETQTAFIFERRSNLPLIVNAGTVCQYVWITDDNKEKVFQGDKCYLETEDYIDTGNTVFDEGYKGEVVVEFNEDGVFLVTEDLERIHLSLIDGYKLVLIGNIHDK